MSGLIYEVWGSPRAGYWAKRWDPAAFAFEYATGPFATELEAMAWAKAGDDDE